MADNSAVPLRHGNGEGRASLLHIPSNRVRQEPHEPQSLHSEVEDPDPYLGQKAAARLNVRLLKERLEMEVGLRREGLRALVFCAVCVCFCVMLFISTQPTMRNASRWYISERLNLSQLERVSSKDDAFATAMNIASRGREFYPLSSDYWSDPLSKTLVAQPTSFPAGPMELPAEMHPSLALEWSLTARLQLHNPDDPLHKKRLIVRKILPGDTSGLSCWGWYCWGMDKFVLEYGRHNIDDSYPIAEFVFARGPNFTTDLSAFNFIAVTANSTHVSLHMQGAESQSIAFPPGSIPSDCPDGVLEVGDLDIMLANLEYHPFVLSRQQMEEIQHSGQVLAEMATGVAVTQHTATGVPESSDASRQTQQLVVDYSESILSVSRLSGALSFTASQNQGAEDDVDGIGLHEGVGDDHPGNASSIGYPLPLDNPAWELGSLEGMDAYWQVVGGRGVQVGGLVSRGRTSATANATAAMIALAAAQQSAGRPADFTYSWWARASAETGAAEFAVGAFSPSVEATSSGPLKFAVSRITEGDGSTTVSGWIISFRGAPWCAPEDELCLAAPAMWCQAPDGVGYDGIWRHYAFTFSHVGVVGEEDAGNRSTLQLYLDGRQLCGISFPASPDFILHHFEQGDVAVPFMPTDLDTASKAELAMRDARLYARALNSSEIKAVATVGMDCLDTEVNFDNSLWLSDFGQSCADLAAQSVAGTPAACRSPEALENCPVSCMHELSPMCSDGTPPLPRPGSTFSIGSRLPVAQIYLLNPSVAQTWRPISLSEEVLTEMLDNAAFLGDTADGEWYPLNAEIRKMEFSTLMLSRTALLADGPFWITSFNMSDPGWCPGAGLDFQVLGLDYQAQDLDQKAIVQELCLSELLFWDMFTRVEEEHHAGSGRSVIDAIGVASTTFPDGLMPVGKSFSIYFWARTNDITSGSAPRIIGVDSEHNICFSVRGAVAWLQQINLVEEYEEWLVESAANATETTEDEGVLEGSEGESEGEELLAGSGNGGGAEWSPWRAGRLEVKMSDNGRATLKANEWAFFALVVDPAMGKVRFALNGFVREVDLPRGTWGLWGCSSLTHIINTGSDMEISPLRIGRFALTTGSLQRIYLAARPDYINVFQGEARSRLERLARVEREHRRFKSGMLSLSPPMLLQRRVNSSSTDKCTGETIEAVNEQLKRRLEAKCQRPFKCERGVSLEMRCPSEDAPPPERFFGQDPVTFLGNQSYFPEFAWTMQSSALVRDGVELRPKVDYVDEDTQELMMVMTFFVPKTQVATMLYVTYDMREVKMVTRANFLQIKLLDDAEIQLIASWGISAMALAVISIFLAMPAAIQEFVEFRRERQSAFKKVLKLFGGRRMLRRVKSINDRPAYTNNTTQPDILDVVMNVAFIVLQVSLITNKYSVWNNGGALYAKLAGIDWAGDEPFQEKIDLFISHTLDGVRMVEAEATYLILCFWMLSIFCARVIIFMQMHPTIASVSQTFASVGRELINFMFSFGVIYMFLAFIAHMQFGFLYDEFSTIRQSLITQFSILVGDSTPDYSTDTMMCIYVVAFVFVCSLSLLNFFLAIVVNGYTKVTERVLENRVAQSFAADALLVPMDVVLWLRNRRWPSKLAILNTLYRNYPDVFENEEVEVMRALPLERFREVVITASGKKGATAEDADRIFEHYCRLEVLLMREGGEGDTQSSAFQNDNKSRLWQ